MTTAGAFLRFLADARRFVREGLTLADARAEVRRNLERREDAFLELVRAKVFGPSPVGSYRWLFDQARCEYGDVEISVRRDGLAAALVRLHDSGVFMSFEEFKGRRPIERGGRTFDTTTDGFDMGGSRGAVRGSSGGSSGGATGFAVTVPGLAADATLRRCLDAMLGFPEMPFAHWWEILPSPTGVQSLLRRAAGGYPPERWFFPPIERGGLGNARARIATELIVRAAGAGGSRLPRPERLALDEASVIVRWAEERLASMGRCGIATGVSRAVRIATSAVRMGVDLTGTTFDIGGEPITEAKASAINASGARYVPVYFIGEAGFVGAGCGNPLGTNDLHLVADRFAVDTRQRAHGDVVVDELCLTTLAQTSPKLMINVATDDVAVVEERSCGCALEELGLATHLRDIYGVSKLTGEGVTLVGSDMVRVLEEVLPARFGGSPLDYQLVEEEIDALTRLTLIVSPSVDLPDPEEAVRVLLEGLGSGGLATDVRGLWGEAGTVRVQRRQPFVSARGKQAPIVSARRFQGGMS